MAFWNQTSSEIGSPFRLGPVSTQTGAIPVGELADMSAAVTTWLGPPFPASLARWPGDIVVALPDAAFVSFAARMAGP
jgi:hypothetical protein